MTEEQYRKAIDLLMYRPENRKTASEIMAEMHAKKNEVIRKLHRATEVEEDIIRQNKLIDEGFRKQNFPEPFTKIDFDPFKIDNIAKPPIYPTTNELTEAHRQSMKLPKKLWGIAAAILTLLSTPKVFEETKEMWIEHIRPLIKNPFIKEAKVVVPPNYSITYSNYMGKEFIWYIDRWYEGYEITNSTTHLIYLKGFTNIVIEGNTFINERTNNIFPKN